VLGETAAPDSPKGLGIPLNASFQVLWSSWDAVWWIWESHELIYGWYKFHWYKSQLISPFHILYITDGQNGKLTIPCQT
jgi:hypothetical protein